MSNPLQSCKQSEYESSANPHPTLHRIKANNFGEATLVRPQQNRTHVCCEGEARHAPIRGPAIARRQISKKTLKSAHLSNLEIPTTTSHPSPPSFSSALLHRACNMGILETISGPLAQQISQRGTAVVVASGFAAFLVLAVVLNVLSQLLFKNPNEPPMVFHWLPIIGSTVTYGIDPYRFFSENRAKVSSPLNSESNDPVHTP